MHLPVGQKKGNFVYKQEILSSHKPKQLSLYLELKKKCQEGGGLVVYLLGISDLGEIVGLTSDGFNRSWDNLQKIIKMLKGSVLQKTINQLANGKFWATVFILNYNLQDRFPGLKETTYNFKMVSENPL